MSGRRLTLMSAEAHEDARDAPDRTVRKALVVAFATHAEVHRGERLAIGTSGGISHGPL